MKNLCLLIILLLSLSITQCQQKVTSINDIYSSPPSPRVKSNYTSGNLTLFNLFANNQCNLPEIPKKFGIATMTRFRATGENDLTEGINFFKQFLQQFAEMECDAFDSIYFIWNNQKAPEEYPGLLQRKSKWTKNVYFIHTKFNSLNHRYALPSWAPEQVFMSLDDDADVDCENLKKGFSKWQENTISGLGPFGALSYSGRTMQYHIDTDMFEYKYGTSGHISMGLTNTGIIPRHFMDLYYARMPEFQKIREVVSEYLNCEDIGLNFMIGYVYPELKPIAIREANAGNKPFVIEINKSPGHWEKRSSCLNKFSQFLGANTNSYNVINKNQTYESTKGDPLRRHECLFALKRAIIEEKYLNYEHFYNNIRSVHVYNFSELSPEIFSHINSDNYILSLSQETRNKLISENKIDISYKPRNPFNQIFNVNKQQSTKTKQDQFSSNEVFQLLRSNARLENSLRTYNLLLVVTNVVFITSLLFFIVKALRQKTASKKRQMNLYQSRFQQNQLGSAHREYSHLDFNSNANIQRAIDLSKDKKQIEMK